MIELKLIEEFYGERCAKRSGVKLINHIKEGLAVLEYIDASELAMRAYCLHPIVQNDIDLMKNLEMLKSVDGRVVALAMEYRRVANAYLSFRKINGIDEIELSPLKDVNDMLIADKIQNRKDFNAYHLGSHPRSKELDEYFANWFARLEISDDLARVI